MFHKTGPLKGKPRGFAFIEFKSKDVRVLSVMIHAKLTCGAAFFFPFCAARTHSKLWSNSMINC